MLKIFDVKKLKIKINKLNAKQKQLVHLVDPRFFHNKKNTFRFGKEKKNFKYVTDLQLSEDFFHMHPLLDSIVLEQGNVRRFPAGINKKYIKEKYFDDKWVSEGNNALSKELENYIKSNLEYLRRKRIIKMVDFGPCGGAITTLFALRAFDKYDLLSKVVIYLLDIVPNVLEATLLGEFNVPQQLIDEYKLHYVGKDAKDYKKMLNVGILCGVKQWYKHHPYSCFAKQALNRSKENEKLFGKKIKVKYFRGDGEILQKEIKGFDVALSGYTHHHMNLIGRKMFCQQMEKAVRKKGFIGVVDFYVRNYNEYMIWYRHHFEKHHDAPPVEYPLIDVNTIAKWYSKIKIIKKNDKLERSFLLVGIKK